MRPEVRDIAVLYEAHARRLWRLVARLGVAPAHIEDLVQEVFLTAHQRRREFEGRSTAATWLTGIAVRLAANARRKRTADAPLADALSDPGLGPEADLERRRALASLEKVLSQLPEEQREIVVLIDLEGLSAPDAAEVLEVKLNTVYSRLRLGRAALTRALNPAAAETRS